MRMVMFATPTELATYLRTATQAEADAGNPDVLDTAVAQLLLENATGAIREVCGWSISEETVTEVLDWTDRTLFLPTLRLTAITVTIDGVLAVDGVDYTWKRNGTLQFWRRTPWSPTAALQVTYTHGYDTVPAGVRAVCLEQAAIAYANPSLHFSETADNVVTVYGRGFDLRADPRLAPYQLPAVA